MAWRRELTDGFETGLPAYFSGVQGGLNGVKNGSIYSLYSVGHYSYYAYMGVSAGVGRNGGYAFVSNVSISGGIGTPYMRYALLNASHNLSLRLYVYSLGANIAEFRPIRFANGYVALNPSARTVSLIWSSPSVTITSAPLDLAAAWICVEVKVRTDGANSLLALRVNGQDIGSNVTADLGSDGVAYVDYGQPITPTVVNLFYLDDIAINVGDLADDVPWCGLCSGIVASLPVADSGSINAWTPSTGTTRYTIVDDIPQKWTGTLPYIASGVNGDRQALKLKTRAQIAIPDNSLIKSVALFATAMDGSAIGSGLKPLITKTDAANPLVYDAWDVGGAPDPNRPGINSYTGMMKLISSGEDPMNTSQQLTLAEFDKLLVGVESIIP